MAKLKRLSASEAAREDASKVAGKTKLASDSRAASTSKKKPPMVPATTKFLNQEVVYVDSEGKECHARVVAGDSETVNVVVTMNDVQNPTKLVPNVKRGKGSTPHTWHPKS